MTLFQAVRPTVLVGVPRVWEKFKEKIEAQLSQVTGLKEVVMSKARSVGRQTSLNRQSGRPAAWGYWLANMSVFIPFSLLLSPSPNFTFLLSPSGVL